MTSRVIQTWYSWTIGVAGRNKRLDGIGVWAKLWLDASCGWTTGVAGQYVWPDSRSGWTIRTNKMGPVQLISRYAGKRSIGHVADVCWNWPTRPTSPYYHGQRPPLLCLVWLLSTYMYIFVLRSALLVSFSCLAHWKPLLLSILCQCTGSC
jgi:hypothetical protein